MAALGFPGSKKGAKSAPKSSRRPAGLGPCQGPPRGSQGPGPCPGRPRGQKRVKCPKRAGSCYCVLFFFVFFEAFFPSKKPKKHEKHDFLGFCQNGGFPQKPECCERRPWDPLGGPWDPLGGPWPSFPTLLPGPSFDPLLDPLPPPGTLKTPQKPPKTPKKPPKTPKMTPKTPRNHLIIDFLENQSAGGHLHLLSLGNLHRHRFNALLSTVVDL